MAEQRKNGQMPWLRPDCKSQVIVEYEKVPSSTNERHVKPKRIFNILISTQHEPQVDQDFIR